MNTAASEHGDGPAHDIRAVDASGTAARGMSRALWAEIQERYGFSAADPFDPAAFSPPGGFWVAFDDDGSPIGSVALAAMDATRGELDVMYVTPGSRRRGVAEALLGTLMRHAASVGLREVVLRAGNPQPDALAFYTAQGFEPTEAFGRWVGDETAICFRRTVA